MGSYNRLKIQINCPQCKKKIDGTLQFRFGDIWFYEYKIGDNIKSNGASEELSDYLVYCILEDSICPYCQSLLSEEYDMLVEKGRIVYVSLMKDYSMYLKENEGNYIEIRA